MEIMSWILSAANAITNDTADSTASAANRTRIFKRKMAVVSRKH